MVGCARYNFSGWENNGSVISNIEGTNVIVDGNITADFFIGDGSQLTNLNLSNVTEDKTATSNITQLFNSTGNIIYFNDSTASLGIRTTTPGSALEVVGSLELDNLFDNDGSNFFDLSGPGAPIY